MFRRLNTINKHLRKEIEESILFVAQSPKFEIRPYSSKVNSQIRAQPRPGSQARYFEKQNFINAAAHLASRIHKGDNLKLTGDYSPKALCAVPLIFLRALEKNTIKTDLEKVHASDIREMISDEFFARWRTALLHDMKRRSLNLEQCYVAKAIHWIHEVDKRLASDWLGKIGAENIDKMALYALNPVKGIRSGDYEALLKALCIAHGSSHDLIKIDDRLLDVLQKTLPFYKSYVLKKAYYEKVEQKIEACKILHLLICELGVQKPKDNAELAEKILYRLNKIGDQIFQSDSTLLDVLLFNVQQIKIFLAWNIRWCPPRKTKTFEELDDLHYKFMTRFLRSLKIFETLNNRTIAVGLKIFLRIALSAEETLEPKDENSIRIIDPIILQNPDAKRFEEKLAQFERPDLCWRFFRENIEFWCQKMTENAKFLKIDEIQTMAKLLNDKKDKFSGDEESLKNVSRAILCWDE